MEYRDYYKVLGLSKKASTEQIKKAFRKLARQYHPDVNPEDRSAEKRFKEINEANEVLGDPETRSKYDDLGANWRRYEQTNAAGMDPFGNPKPSGFGEAGTGYTRVSGQDLRDILGGDSFSDFFQTFFSGRSAAGFPDQNRYTQQPIRGRDVEKRLDLTLEQAFHGLGQRLSLTTGTGARTVDVRIPAGVTDGSRVRVAGEGQPGTGTHAGDLFLRVRLKHHAKFEQKKRDLYSTVKIPITTAVLGGDVEVPTIEGTAVRLKIPERTQAGQTFRLKGRGMKHLRGTARGDLYATVQIALPPVLSGQARQHYEALAALERAKKPNVQKEGGK